MANPRRPYVSVINNQATYHSLDAIDQSLYDGFSTRSERNAFLELVRRWLTVAREGGTLNRQNFLLCTEYILAKVRPASGQDILDRWNVRGRHFAARMKKHKGPQPTHTAAIQAVVQAIIVPMVPLATVQAGSSNMVPKTIVTTATAAILPSRSPLVERSPRFASANDPKNGIVLSPTYGQLQFIAGQLKVPWCFANVPFQSEPASKSVFMFVRSDLDNVIEEVSLGLKKEVSMR
jgi:hypothetical protein